MRTLESAELLNLLESALESERVKVAELTTLKHEKILIYGAGLSGIRVLRALQNRGLESVAFLDRAAASKNPCQGIPVLLPDDSGLSDEERRSALVLISIPVYFNARLELCNNLRSWGYEHIYYAYPYFNSFTDGAFQPGWKARAMETFHSVEDSVSKNVYAQNLAAFLLYEPETRFFASSQGLGYLPGDIPLNLKNMRLVDCGAYDGDSLQDLVSCAETVDAYVGFEPLYSLFTKLKDRLEALKDKIGTGILIPAALGNSFEMVPFNMTNDLLGSAVSRDGNSSVMMVKLDDVLPGFAPTFIKMDIEGSEFDALMGAKNIIEKNRPALAISVYHFVDHFWEIPSLIRSWNLRYKFYLRHYCDDWIDTVFFAVPE